MPVLIDFESRSRADLKTVGGRRYWEHASSEALCCVWYDTRDGSVGVWTPGQPWPHAGRTLAAHNANGFDRFAAERYGFAAAGWIDTSQLARKAGLPGALDALGERWLGTPKDDAGSKYTKSLSGKRPPKLDLDRVVAYCASDVAILAGTWERLSEWVPVDAEVEALDVVVNDRGVCFDVALAKRLLAEDERNAAEAVAACAALCSATPAEVAAAARSPQQFCAITGCADATAETVEACAHPLARVRKALASIAAGKLRAGLARVHADGRLRDTLRYYGGHTGRWSGKGMQLQNLPRPVKRFEGVDVDALAEAVLAGAPADAETIALLVRATLTASPGNRLAVCDFSSVEARATAWAAGDADAVAVFMSGRDPYKVAAGAVFQVEYDAVDKSQRQVGKVAELACGYGGGPNAFAKMAHTYKLGKALDGLDLRAIVDAWRALHRPIVSLWYACERAFRSAVGGRSQWAGPFEFVPAKTGDAVACFLPSGRPVVYQGATASDDGLAYHGGRGATEHLYGGKLVENAIQALCRDLMTAALIRAEAAGLPVVLHVHDELVCDVPAASAEASYATLKACMLELPPWAAGFPIGADGWTGRRYRK